MQSLNPHRRRELTPEGPAFGSKFGPAHWELRLASRSTLRNSHLVICCENTKENKIGASADGPAYGSRTVRFLAIGDQPTPGSKEGERPGLA